MNICTAHADLEHKQVCLQRGADKLFTKPTPLELLEASIEEFFVTPREERGQPRQLIL